jgi:hypothetical protein
MLADQIEVHEKFGFILMLSELNLNADKRLLLNPRVPSSEQHVTSP